MSITSRGIDVTLTESQAAEVLGRYDVFHVKGKGWAYRPREMASDDPWRSPTLADRASAIADAYCEDHLADAYGAADKRESNS